ncbi:hypothetical protein PF010_g18161 [Phytophthora fragariae]|uniref:RxLR effector protein n=3 Tax=Phytophthora TaxID=4783 RepID=A0A6A3Z8H7_9STRA|nr:hypothetical protein PF003_g9328 [Phytophthora fragariae]KAE8938528.1 hypothetical protein PF009_g11600 [Phytophthora fragariae]KAE9012784.1 hypothetical protein PF011_g8768 [Phytophthora fragariae]KAE9091503.1 hypothetical protein PF010_g18161 [Phytophthora fragariae]KAE9143280.1 hypothetical protein PF006_g11668 [Phytophthora fragariae]
MKIFSVLVGLPLLAAGLVNRRAQAVCTNAHNPSMIRRDDGTVGRHMPQPASVTSLASRAAEPLLPPVDKLFPWPNLEPCMKMHMLPVVNETSNALTKDTLMQDEPGSVLWCPASRTRVTPGSIHVLRCAMLDSREAAYHMLLFNADLVQHATLSTLVSPPASSRTATSASSGRSWRRPRFIRNRDFSKKFTDTRGRRVWDRSLHSLKIPAARRSRRSLASCARASGPDSRRSY